ncbi:MAG TPA: hypothetical protein VGK48_23825 [Terriglobia bacterium]|jgi:hypothetical protein
MDRFSLEILERTVQLAIEAMPPDENPRLVECVVTILDYIKSPEAADERTLLPALTELLELARANHQFLIAARLAPIVRQLCERGRNSDVA